MANIGTELSEWDAIFPELEKPLEEICQNVKEFNKKFCVLPRPCQIFKMFEMIHPYEVRVVFIGQSPYPGVCPATGVHYACGPAFLPDSRCKTTPVTLQQIGMELCRDMQVAKLPMPLPSLLLHWISQGVMLLNACLTIGVGSSSRNRSLRFPNVKTDCPKYLEDHSVLWEDIMHKIVHRLSNDFSRNLVFVLIGQSAWKFEKDISGTGKVIKTSHPAAKSVTAFPFVGSGVFSAVSRALGDMGETPVSWLGPSSVL